MEELLDIDSSHRNHEKKAIRRFVWKGILIFNLLTFSTFMLYALFGHFFLKASKFDLYELIYLVISVFHLGVFLLSLLYLLILRRSIRLNKVYVMIISLIPLIAPVIYELLMLINLPPRMERAPFILMTGQLIYVLGVGFSVTYYWRKSGKWN